MTTPLPAGSQTSVILSSLMNPADANFMGNIHGGVIMKLIDEAAATCAFQFCRARVVTAAIDRIDFLNPVAIGNLVVLTANMNYAGTSSMEVGVRVEAEDLASGVITHCASAYVVFVALDDDGRPIPVPTLVPRTDEQKRWFREAEARRAKRLAERRRPQE
jgi:acyl-CoA hydrolase